MIDYVHIGCTLFARSEYLPNEDDTALSKYNRAGKAGWDGVATRCCKDNGARSHPQKGPAEIMCQMPFAWYANVRLLQRRVLRTASHYVYNISYFLPHDHASHQMTL